jgi:hypothetical protein
MSFSYRKSEDGRWTVILTDEPDFVHALNAAPESIEPELIRGFWLIVAFPVWSGPARASVRAAITCAKEQAGKFRLGLRPYEFENEFENWWPGSPMPQAASTQIEILGDEQFREVRISTDHKMIPRWVVLRDGQVVHSGAGPMSSEEVSQLMERVG